MVVTYGAADSPALPVAVSADLRGATPATSIAGGLGIGRHGDRQPRVARVDDSRAGAGVARTPAGRLAAPKLAQPTAT